MLTPTERLRSLAHLYGVGKISNVILDDWRFSVWSGSSRRGQHHYGKGGLAIHVSEVVDLCILNNSSFSGNKRQPEDNVFLAALFHDAGKMYDYQPVGGEGGPLTEWESAPHKKLVHHISRSALIWEAARISHGYLDRSDEVLHAILSHHGRREWGSPVTPQTHLAWLLHISDMMSARMDDLGRDAATAG